MKRLSSSIRILLDSKPDLLFSSVSSSSSSSRFLMMNRSVRESSIYDLVNGSMSEAMRSVVSKERGRLCGEELAVTVLVTGDEEKLSRLDDEKVVDCLDVWLHIGGYSLGVGERAASLALVGRGRDVAAAKYSDWVRYCALSLWLSAHSRIVDSLVSGIKLVVCGLGRLRKPLEKFRPLSTTELLLSNDGDHLLEGCVTNFFVVCRRVQRKAF